MKKEIFQDLLSDTQLPVHFWGFFVFSVVVHIVLVFIFVSVEFSPPEIEIKVKKDGTVKQQPPPRNTVNPGSPAASNPSMPAAAPTDSPTPSAPTGTGTPAAVGNTGRSPAMLPEDPMEPIDLTVRAPQMVYQHPVQNANIDITGNEYVKLYNKPFLDAGKKPESSYPLYRPSRSASSYQQVKQSIQKEEIPPGEMVKIEELVNAFQYEYPLPEDGKPFSVTTELSACPWHASHLLLHIGIQGKIVEADDALRNRDFVVATGMKINVAYNPDTIKAYRLIGYAERKPLPGEKPAEPLEKGQDLRMGQSMTTLYELIPQPPKAPEPGAPPPGKPRLATIEISYKELEKSKQLAYDVFQPAEEKQGPSDDFKFSAAVAQFGMLLKNPDFEKLSGFEKIMEMAADATGEDRRGYRAEFIKLLERYKKLVNEK
jgi:hypothetical protein